MPDFLTFFETIPPAVRTGVLAGGLVLLWLAEGAVPLVGMQYRKVRHALLNLFFTLTTLVINFAFAILIVKTCDWVTANSFGIVHLAAMPLWAQVITGLLVLDLIGAWLIHWIEHKIKWLWKFHLIHHTDTNVDVTTSLRHHPGESVFRAVFTVLAVFVAGVPIGIVMLYQTLSALFAQLTHANISLPPSLDRALSYVIVSPNMHKVHHHYVQPLTDTNYGNIFSIWDRLFGTFAEYGDSGKLKYGIDTHMQPEENARLGNLLMIPFQKYRAPRGAKFSDSDADRAGTTKKPEGDSAGT